jgi:3-oxoacyl-[acyl-carrier-protein] synthase II
MLVLSLMHQVLPPTLGWKSADPGTRLDVISPAARRVAFEIGLSNSFGFGGTNCSLLFRKVA